MTSTHSLVNVDGIPLELRTLPQWVCWRSEKRNEKLTKIPYQPHGAKADSTDPATWSTFDRCLGSVPQKNFNGIGFVFSQDDPYCGVDLDKCLDPETGEFAPWADAIIARMDSYTELSQSRKGAHIIVKATLPTGRRRTGGIEMYDIGRFFVMTGNLYPGAVATIEPRQEELTALHAEIFPPAAVPSSPGPYNGAPLTLTDRELLDKMFAAANGATVRCLWEGGVSGHDSHSEADMALCSHLSFWTGGDAVRMDALFRQSGLMRDKWDERHGKQTYGQMTIARALEGQKEFYDSGRQAPMAVNGATRQTQDDPWPTPQPLPDRLPSVPPFNAELLPETVRPWVEDIAERMQCPLDFPAVATTTCIAAAVGRQVGIRPKRHDDWIVIPNLWGDVIGRPGVMKTPAITEPLSLIHELEKTALEAHRDKQRTYEANAVLAEAKKKQAKKDIESLLRKGDPRGAQTIANSLPDMDAGEAPTRKRYLTNDTTVEKLGELLAENPNGILVFRDELTGLLQNLDREDRVGSRAFYLEAWNGTGRFTYDRIARGTIDIEAACISILGGIQPGPLSAYLAATLKQGVGDDGLLQRFQLMVWPDISGEWRNVDRCPNTAAKQDVAELIQRLAKLHPDEIGAEHDESSPIPFLRFDHTEKDEVSGETAQDKFDAWRAGLEHRLRNHTLHPAFEAHLSKYRSLIPSLALLYHLADDGQGPVGLIPTVAALSWGTYLEAHARRVYAIALDNGLAAAHELYKHLLAGHLPNPFPARTVYLKGWSLLDQEGTQRALEYLEELGHIRGVRRDTGGRPQVIWQVNPALKFSK